MFCEQIFNVSCLHGGLKRQKFLFYFLLLLSEGKDYWKGYIFVNEQ